MKAPVSALPFAITFALSATAASSPAQADSASEQLKQALTQSSVSAHFRYRLEYVDQDNQLDDAFASTLRSRFSVR